MNFWGRANINSRMEGIGNKVIRDQMEVQHNIKHEIKGKSTCMVRSCVADRRLTITKEGVWKEYP